VNATQIDAGLDRLARLVHDELARRHTAPVAVARAGDLP
jgi:hypothetical protein